MFFTGKYEHSIDSKQRLAIPAQVRSQWRPEKDGDAFMAVPWKKGIIRLYAENDFKKRAESEFLTLTPDEDEAESQVNLYSNCERLEMDSAGRIRLSEDLLELSGLGRDVVLLGAGDRLEIRDRENWKRNRQSGLEQLPELIERISAKRERGLR